MQIAIDCDAQGTQKCIELLHIHRQHSHPGHSTLNIYWWVIPSSIHVKHYQSLDVNT